jgi:hypothetical protein
MLLVYSRLLNKLIIDIALSLCMYMREAQGVFGSLGELRYYHPNPAKQTICYLLARVGLPRQCRPHTKTSTQLGWDENNPGHRAGPARPGHGIWQARPGTAWPVAGTNLSGPGRRGPRDEKSEKARHGSCSGPARRPEGPEARRGPIRPVFCLVLWFGLFWLEKIVENHKIRRKSQKIIENHKKS